MAKEKEVLYRTPLGRISHPYLVDPYENDEGKQSWGTQILVTPEAFKEATNCVKAVNDLGQKTFGEQWSLKTAKNKCIQKTDEMESMTDERTKGLIAFKTKSTGPVYCVDAQGKPMSIEDIRKIKGGHWGRAVFGLYTYDTRGNKGVSLGLRVLQYWKPDEEFGVGVSEALKLVDTLEIPVVEPTLSSGLDDIM